MAAGATVIEKTVDNYEVIIGHVLGQGTFGSVHLGRDMRTNDGVAIKCVVPPIQFRALYMRYIQNEIDTLNSIDHPNIVDLIYYKQIGHCTYFVLELCDCDLQKFASENDVFEELKFDFILGISEGLNCLHGHRIIHRDIKPENVLVKEAHGTRTAKLTDLGLSRRVPEGGSASFSATPGIGTEQWMAPEAFADTEDHARYSMPADIYAFGLLSWSVIVHRAGEFLWSLSGPRGMCIGKWTHQQQSAGHAVNIPELTGGEDNATVQAMKQTIKRMIHPEASQRYKVQEVCDAFRSIVDGSIPAEAPATGLSVAQVGSHVHLSNVRQFKPETSHVPENMAPQTGGSSQAVSLSLNLERPNPLPTPPHNSPGQQSGYVPPTSETRPQMPLSVSMPQSQMATAEKVKLRILSRFTPPAETKHFDLGQQLDILLHTYTHLHTLNDPTVLSYCRYTGTCISEVNKWSFPQGHKYECNKFITPQHVVLQSFKNQLSCYNHELGLTMTLSCPGWVIGVIGDHYAVVKSRPGTTVAITSFPNTQEIHHELKLPHPKAYDDANLFACGWPDGRVAIAKKGGRYTDFYSTAGHHIQRADADGVTGVTGRPSCTAQHVLVPMDNQPRTILVFTWTGEFVQRIAPSGLGPHDECCSISPVHEGKLNMWVYNKSDGSKVITCEIQGCEDKEDDDEMMHTDDNGQ